MFIQKLELVFFYHVKFFFSTVYLNLTNAGSIGSRSIGSTSATSVAVSPHPVKRKNISTIVSQPYFAYLKIKLDNENKMCKQCVESL